MSIPGAAGLWVWFDARCALEVHPGTTERLRGRRVCACVCLFLHVCVYTPPQYGNSSYGGMCCFVRTDSVESKTSLSFYADREHRVLLKRFVGSPHNFRPFVVPTDSVYYEYVFDPRDPPCFGVRFTVSRLTGLWLQVG